MPSDQIKRLRGLMGRKPGTPMDLYPRLGMTTGVR